MKQPKVSIIVPVYKVEKYLVQCLDSIVGQTLKDIEIICINDGSTDNTLHIIKQIAQKDSRIVVINQKNKGVASARNTGIKNARGNYIAFMDADDFYPQNDVLEDMYLQAVKQQALIVGGSFYDIDAQTQNSLKHTHTGFYQGFDFQHDGFINYKNYQFDYGYYRFIYKRNFIQKNHLYFPLYKRYQDPPFFVKVMFKAKKFYAMARDTYGYSYESKHFEEMSAAKVKDLITACMDIIKFAQDNKLDQLLLTTIKGRIFQQYRKVIYNHLGNQKVQKAYVRLLNVINSKKIKKIDFPMYELLQKEKILFCYRNIFKIHLFKYIPLFSIEQKGNTCLISILNIPLIKIKKIN